MYLIELSQQIIRDMKKRKLRSILAMFGIVWGTVAVVLLLALGQGFYNTNKANMMKLADGTLVFWGGKTSMSFQGLPIGQQIHIKAQDVMTMKKALPTIEYASPVFSSRKNASYQSESTRAHIRGVSADYFQLRKMDLAPGGRFFNSSDVKNHTRVVVIGSVLKTRLFGKKEGLGKTIQIAGLPFLVIGVLQQNSNGGMDFSGGNRHSATIPYTTYQLFAGNADINRFFIKAKHLVNTQLVEKQIYRYFGDKLHFNPNDKSALGLFNLANMLSFFTWFFRAIELFLGFCGAMTLGVAAVGVANILFLIVRERTNEIGLRMALGAQEKQILSLILLESSIIVGIGGLIGFIISAIVIVALHYVPLPTWLGTPVFTPLIFVATLLILTIIGLCAGYFPARRAARLTPVEALRQ